LASGAVGFALADPWQDWTIKRLNKDRNELRRLLTAEQKAVEHYARRLKEANHENSLLNAESANLRTRGDALSEINQDMTEAAITFRGEMDRLHSELALAGKPDQPRDELGRYKPFAANDSGSAAVGSAAN
jgi:chromosome segregation ATPase